jgi:hypothetical protein
MCTSRGCDRQLVHPPNTTIFEAASIFNFLQWPLFTQQREASALSSFPWWLHLESCTARTVRWLWRWHVQRSSGWRCQREPPRPQL